MDLKGIEDLHRLKTEGVITEEEFEQAKQRLLFGAARPAAPSPMAGIAAALNQGAPAALPAVDDHLAWVMLPLRRYADFTGRSCRREYWMFQLLYVAIGVVVFLALGSDAGTYGGIGALGGLTLLSACIAVLGLTVPLIAVQVRRFHDQDKSGLFALINLVPYAGAIVVLVFMLLEGTRGENRFGPDPLA